MECLWRFVTLFLKGNLDQYILLYSYLTSHTEAKSGARQKPYTQKRYVDFKIEHKESLTLLTFVLKLNQYIKEIKCWILRTKLKSKTAFLYLIILKGIFRGPSMGTLLELTKFMVEKQYPPIVGFFMLLNFQLLVMVWIPLSRNVLWTGTFFLDTLVVTYHLSNALR